MAQANKEEPAKPDLFEIFIISSTKNGQPCIELRKTITDMDIIKKVLSAAFHDKPLVIQPAFTSKIRSLNSLVDCGILYYEPADQQYYFCFD